MSSWQNKLSFRQWEHTEVSFHRQNCLRSVFRQRSTKLPLSREDIHFRMQTYLYWCHSSGCCQEMWQDGLHSLLVCGLGLSRIVFIGHSWCYIRIRPHMPTRGARHSSSALGHLYDLWIQTTCFSLVCNGRGGNHRILLQRWTAHTALHILLAVYLQQSPIQSYFFFFLFSKSTVM